MSQENLKLKNLLKKVLENKEFEYSFNDRTEGIWDGYDYEIIDDKYTFEYHIEVENVLGSGSKAVASIDVIIDKILLNNEDIYYDWVDSNYSENVWYIDYLHDHLVNEVLDVIPVSIYPTFYGHDEE